MGNIAHEKTLAHVGQDWGWVVINNHKNILKNNLSTGWDGKIIADFYHSQDNSQTKTFFDLVASKEAVYFFFLR